MHRVHFWDSDAGLNPRSNKQEFSFLFVVCGENKRLEEAITTFIDYQEKGDEGLCTNVPISDRFSLTAAHCLEEGADR